MKARFYRGPWNGKVREVRDSESFILVNEFKTNTWRDMMTANPTSAIMYNTYRYYRTNHTHPDGSVFFEWDKPPGTRIK